MRLAITPMYIPHAPHLPTGVGVGIADELDEQIARCKLKGMQLGCVSKFGMVHLGAADKATPTGVVADLATSSSKAVRFEDVEAEAPRVDPLEARRCRRLEEPLQPQRSVIFPDDGRQSVILPGGD